MNRLEPKYDTNPATEIEEYFDYSDCGEKKTKYGRSLLWEFHLTGNLLAAADSRMDSVLLTHPRVSSRQE